MLWVGWCLWRAPTAALQTDLADEDAADAAPTLQAAPSFWHGVLLQSLNPKAWMACAAGTAMFAQAPVAHALVTFVAIYFVVCYLSLMVWGIVGEKLAVFLNQGNRAHIFNMLMGIVLIMISLQMCWGYFYS